MERLDVDTRVETLRALIVSYNFPPVGGAGVQRSAKLYKYLPSCGVIPSVLTALNPSVPLADDSMLGDLPIDARIIRVPTLEPGYGVKQAAWHATCASADGAAVIKRQLVNLGKQLAVPDAQVLWQPAAQLALYKELRGPDAPEVVCISGPPFSQFLLAPLARRLKAAVVLDYRDEWSTYRKSYEMMGRLAASGGEYLEEKLLRHAQAVTTATEAFRRELLGRFSFLDPETVHAIPNGYDPDDFPADLPEPRNDKFVVTYAGTVFKLTSARGLLAALRLLQTEEPELSALLEVRFIGRIVDTEADAFEGSEALGVRRIGYMSHRNVLEELARSHLVCCILDEVAGTERIYPAKIFELMYLQRPVLTLAPEGALAELVRRHQLGELVAPRAATAICEILKAKLREFRAGRYIAKAPAVEIERYHRRALAERFARVFRHAAALGRA